jgi:hypothetical protein
VCPLFDSRHLHSHDVLAWLYAQCRLAATVASWEVVYEFRVAERGVVT